MGMSWIRVSWVWRVENWIHGKSGKCSLQSAIKWAEWAFFFGRGILDSNLIGDKDIFMHQNKAGSSYDNIGCHTDNLLIVVVNIQKMFVFNKGLWGQ